MLNIYMLGISRYTNNTKIYQVFGQHVRPQGPLPLLLRALAVDGIAGAARPLLQHQRGQLIGLQPRLDKDQDFATAQVQRRPFFKDDFGELVMMSHDWRDVMFMVSTILSKI